MRPAHQVPRHLLGRGRLARGARLADPSYWHGEDDYGVGVFERDDFARLADQRAGIRGRFILSINATDGAREVFARFDVEEVEVTYTIAVASAGVGKRVKELIVRSL